jgi:uncharacterized protein YlxP (DUF503 family)
MIGVLTVYLFLPGCASLKEKRAHLQPLLHRLHRQFNVAVAEMDYQDRWQEALVSCAMLGNDSAYLQAALEHVRHWMEKNWSAGEIVSSKIELI